MEVASIAGRFEIAGPVDAVEPHSGGHINEGHVVSAGGRRYLLQCLNPNVFHDPDAVMANVMAVTAHLRERGEPTLTVVPAGGRPCWHGWRMYELVERATAACVASPHDADAVGRCLGRFHRVLADLDPGTLHVTLPAFHDPARRLDALLSVGGGDDGGRGDAAEERGLILDLRHLVAMGTRLASLPVRVAHNDAKAGNVLVDTRTGQPLMLVDLDTVMPGTVLWDVGDLVRSATATVPEDEPGAAFDRARYDALIGGWRAELDGVLTAEENGLIGIAAPVVTYEQAVRFLTDHLMGDVYYRTTRPGQNLDRARSQLSLLQSMLDSLGVRSP